MAKHYDEVSVIRALNRKKEIHVRENDKVIEILKDSSEVGNGSWGKIDYLVNYHSYIYIFKTNINKKFRINDDDNVVNSKTAKRERKLNMATMAKAAMRKAKSK